MQLRPYQAEAIEKIKWAMTMEGNDLLQLPTGAGKSIVTAEIANYLQQNILILQPTVEILEQNKAKLSQYVDQSEIGVYSASVGEKIVRKYTFATIGSVHKVPCLFSDFKVVIIDEAHLVNLKEAGSMYMSLLRAMGKPKVIGLTATVYRVTPTYFKGEDRLGGLNLYQSNSIKMLNRIIEKRGEKPFWSRLLYTMDPVDLIDQGYLCKLQYYDATTIKSELIPLNKSKTDFDMEAYDKIVSKVDDQVVELVRLAQKDNKHVLVFCNSLMQSDRLKSYFPGSENVSGGTPKKERMRIINDFKNGKIQTVFNVGVLTTGFDMPSLDAIVLLRPTRSLGLYYQMLGRGLRISPGKTHCNIYDWSDSVKRLGKLETISVKKVATPKGTMLWNVTTETKPEGWHGIELYKFVIRELSLKPVNNLFN